MTEISGEDTIPLDYKSSRAVLFVYFCIRSYDVRARSTSLYCLVHYYFPALVGMKPAEILRRMTKQIKEETISRVHSVAWHNQFVYGREYVENNIQNYQRRTSITDNFLRLISLCGSLRLQMSSGEVIVALSLLS